MPVCVLAIVILVISLMVYRLCKFEVDMSGTTNQVEEMEIRQRELEMTLKNHQGELSRLEIQLRKVKEELVLERKDKTGLVDYAYGGKVVSVGDTETLSGRGPAVLGVGLCGGARLQRRILEESVAPGECWPFRGQKGNAFVELVRPVVVTHVTLEHAPAALLPEDAASAAPREFSLYGHSEESAPPHLFGDFAYRRGGREAQTFRVAHPIDRAFRIVELKVNSNHGNQEYTCVYRVRVHGDPREK